MFNISIEETGRAVDAVRQFVPTHQLNLIGTLCRSEEGDFFRGKLVEYAERVTLMPKAYEQDGLGEDAVAHLHYFSGGCDWWITEKDMGDEQAQAFGLADLGYGGELGYISLVELCASKAVEIDLHWTPATLGEIKARKPATA